jgi:glucose-6-phosphate 1-dehydrogenase
VLKATRTLSAADVIRGQFNGYRKENGVKPDSTVETYAALRLFIDSERWQSVPFYIRAGKSLPVTITEVIAILKKVPAAFIDENPAPNYVRFRVTPNLVIAIGALVKKPGDEMEGSATELLATEHSDAAEPTAYEELLDDAMHGNSAFFAREDYVEEAWRIVQPVLDNATPIHTYNPGTWGPAKADALVPGEGGWRNPD